MQRSMVKGGKKGGVSDLKTKNVVPAAPVPPSSVQKEKKKGDAERTPSSATTVIGGAPTPSSLKVGQVNNTTTQHHSVATTIAPTVALLKTPVVTTTIISTAKSVAKKKVVSGRRNVSSVVHDDDVADGDDVDEMMMVAAVDNSGEENSVYQNNADANFASLMDTMYDDINDYDAATMFYHQQLPPSHSSTTAAAASSGRINNQLTVGRSRQKIAAAAAIAAAADEAIALEVEGDDDDDDDAERGVDDEEEEEEEEGKEENNDDGEAALIFAALEIGSGAPIVDEVEECILIGTSETSAASDKSKFLNSLWELLCNVAYECTSSKEQRGHVRDLWVALAVYFGDALANLNKKEEWMEKLFRFLPDRKWPEDFLQMVAELKEKIPSASWQKKYKNILAKSGQGEDTAIDQDEARKIFFGYTIAQCASQSRSYVINYLNKRFIPSHQLSSGKSPSDMFLAIRNAIWPADVHRRAKASVDQKYARKKKSNDGTDKEAEKATMLKMAIEKEHAVPKPSWRPTSWISFVLLGTPAGKHQYLTMGGRSGDGCGSTTFASKNERRLERQMAGRMVEPSAQISGQKRTANGVAVNAANAAPMTHHHVFTIARAGQAPENPRLAALERKDKAIAGTIELLKELDPTDPRINVKLKERLEISLEKEKILAEIDGIA